MMTRAEAIALCLKAISTEAVVIANGYPSRETCALNDRPEHFYMIGSMGLASSIGLGLALARPERRVVIFDADGNALMNLGNMAMAGGWRPHNLVHVIFDNEAYGSTGDQPTLTKRVKLERIARAAGYLEARKVMTKRELRLRIRQLLERKGPSLLLVKVSRAYDPKTPRVTRPPREIARRVRAAVIGPTE